MNPDSCHRGGAEAQGDSEREFELLLCVARKSPDGESTARMKALLSQPVNWESLLEKAEQQGLTPFLYRHLIASSEPSVPSTIRERLKKLYNDNTQRNFVRAGKLCEILELLGHHGIPAFALKGPALGLSVYGDLALRTSFDLDILVRRADILRVKELLLSDGFEPHLGSMNTRQEATFLQTECEYVFYRVSDLIRLEVHWALLPRFFSLSPDLSEIWKAPCYTQFGDTRLPVLPPEEGLLYLCIHGAKHLWHRLLLVCDVAELLRAYPDLNWQRTLDLADRSGSRRVLYLGLHLASEWLGAPLPEDIIEKVRADRILSDLAGELRVELEHCRNTNDMPEAEYRRFQLRLRENRRDRIRVAWRVYFEPVLSDWIHMPLPDRFFKPSSLLRRARLALRVAGHLRDR